MPYPRVLNMSAQRGPNRENVWTAPRRPLDGLGAPRHAPEPWTLAGGGGRSQAGRRGPGACEAKGALQGGSGVAKRSVTRRGALQRVGAAATALACAPRVLAQAPPAEPITASL